MDALKSQLYKQLTTKGADGKVIEIPQFIVVDRNNLANVRGSAGKGMANQVVDPASKIVLTDAAIETDFLPSFRKVTGGEVAGSVIASVFIVVNVFYAWSEFKKSTYFDSVEAMLKFCNSLVAIAGGVAGLSGSMLEAIHGTKLILPKNISINAADILTVAGRRIGGGVTIVCALFDLKSGVEQWEEGHAGLSFAYLISGGAGVMLGICLVFGVLTSWILPLTIFLIAIGIVIMWIKGRDVMEFLGRSYFGIDKKDKKHNSFQEEQKAGLAPIQRIP